MVSTAMASADPSLKRKKVETNNLDSHNTSSPAKDVSLSRFFKSWAWKREHRCMDLTVTASTAPMLPLGEPHPTHLTIKQAKFAAQGFASTVWDSSIVAAKYLEAHAGTLVAGARVCDLSAGCGLIAVVCARLGAAEVVATDLAPNLPLLRENCEANVPGLVRVAEHTWGADVSPLEPPFDVVVACDVMYVREAVQDLVTSLAALISPPAPAPTTVQAAVAATLAQGPSPAEAQAPSTQPHCPSASKGPCVSNKPEHSGKGGRKKRKVGKLDTPAMAVVTDSCQQPHAGAAMLPATSQAPQTTVGGPDLPTPSAPTPSHARASASAEATPAGSARTPCVLLAHGRNRFAEAEFMQAAGVVFDISEVGEGELHPDFQAEDVTLYRLVLK